MRIVQQDLPLGLRFSSPLSSRAGMDLLRHIETVEEYLSVPAAAYGYSRRLRNEIRHAAADARADDWDGDGSLPASQESLDCATEFVAVLPSGFPFPDVDIGRRGEVMFEWRPGARSAVVLSMYPERTIGYAVVRGQARSYGREPFAGVVPEVVLLHLRSMLH